MKQDENPFYALVQKVELDNVIKKLEKIEEHLNTKRNEEPEALEGYVSEKEAMRLLGRKHTWFWKMRNAKELPYTKIGSKVFYLKKDLKSLLDNAKK